MQPVQSSIYPKSIYTTFFLLALTSIHASPSHSSDILLAPAEQPESRYPEMLHKRGVSMKLFQQSPQTDENTCEEISCSPLITSNASVSSAERCAWRNPSGCVDGGLKVKRRLLTDTQNTESRLYLCLQSVWASLLLLGKSHPLRGSLFTSTVYTVTYAPLRTACVSSNWPVLSFVCSTLCA